MVKARMLRIDEQERLKIFIEEGSVFWRIVEALDALGARVYLVGGAVRDLVLGLSLKDLDFEVHGIALDELKKLLQQYGVVEPVGKSFGVLKFVEKLTSDWSVPRSDREGRKPAVKLDPFMGIEKALRRRDLTMNALALDLHTLLLVDPFGGEQDIEEGLLRCIDPEIFIEDPLRFFRVMQFVSRFQMVPDPLLNETCADMDIRGVSQERIEGEVEKMLLWSRHPSLGLRWLLAIGRLDEVFPELGALVRTPQNPHWHPEGSAFEHTMQVIDAAAEYEGLADEERRVLLYAALCHDLGKAVTTRHASDGRLISHGHEIAGVELARKMWKRISSNKRLGDKVFRSVRFHMCPGGFISTGAKDAAYKWLALRLAPELSLALLAALAEADMRGRNGEGKEPLPGPIDAIEKFKKRAELCGVLLAPEAALVTGQDLTAFVHPGEKLGEILKRAYYLQVTETIQDKKLLMGRIAKEFDFLLDSTS